MQRPKSKPFTDVSERTMNRRMCVKFFISSYGLLLLLILLRPNTCKFVCFGFGQSLLRWTSRQGQDIHSSAFNCWGKTGQAEECTYWPIKKGLSDPEAQLESCCQDSHNGDIASNDEGPTCFELGPPPSARSGTRGIFLGPNSVL